VAAFNSHDFTNASVETDSYANRVSADQSFNVGPIPFTARYITAASSSFLYVQFDRVPTSVSTTAGKYTVHGTSAPTVTSVLFTAGKSFARLTLSGTLGAGVYTLSIIDGTVSDGISANIVTPVVI
jgi:hypothetical protein